MNVLRVVSEEIQLTVPLILAAVDVAIGAGPVVNVVSEYGVTSVVRNGAGDYTVTLAADPGVNCTITAGVDDGVIARTRVGAVVSVVVKDLLGAGLDAGFSLLVVATPSA